MKFRKICFFLVLCIVLNPNLAFARDLNYSEHETEDNFIPNNLTLEKDEDISNSQKRRSGSASNSSLNFSKYNDFSMIENINLFLPSNIKNDSISSDYTLEETYSTDLVQEPYTYGYGVVRIYRSNSDPKLFNIQMDSNIKGNKVSKFEKYKVTNISWEISSTNDKTNVVEWSPKETTVVKTDDLPIPPVSNRRFKKKFGVNLLTTFKLFNKNDKITEYGIGQKYKIDLESKKNTYDRVQHLSANIIYKNDANIVPYWNWRWNWRWLKYSI